LLSELRNLGAASAKMLAEAGIVSEPQLRELGAAAAYVAVKQLNGKASLNLLWALEGALSDRDWQVVAKQDRLSLLLQVEMLEGK